MGAKSSGAVITRSCRRKAPCCTPSWICWKERDGFHGSFTTYTTLSPCAMCTAAILHYGIPRVIIGENLSYKGEADLLKNRGVKVDVLQESECMMRMMEFIQTEPELWFDDIGHEGP